MPWHFVSLRWSSKALTPGLRWRYCIPALFSHMCMCGSAGAGSGGSGQPGSYIVYLLVSHKPKPSQAACRERDSKTLQWNHLFIDAQRQWIALLSKKRLDPTRKKPAFQTPDLCQRFIEKGKPQNGWRCQIQAAFVPHRSARWQDPAALETLETSFREKRKGIRFISL